jgi:hypothetical protein
MILLKAAYTNTKDFPKSTGIAGIMNNSAKNSQPQWLSETRFHGFWNSFVTAFFKYFFHQLACLV